MGRGHSTTHLARPLRFTKRMLCKYHISLSCWLLLLIFPTQCSTSECWRGQFTFYLGGRCSNCPSGQTQSGKCLNNGPCCLPCGQSTYQWDYLPEHFNINAGCRRCPVRHQTDLILTSSNRDGLEDCTPCPYEHSYMMQNPVLDIDDVVSFQCRDALNIQHRMSLYIRPKPLLEWQ